MKKFISLGTECVKFLKAARASQGKLLCYVVSSNYLVCLSLIIYLTFFSLFRTADALLMANARIASLQAELEASQRAWDVSTAAKAASKAAATKAKKAEKALVDADQGHIQREQVMTHKYRGSQQSSREVLPKFIDSTQGEPKNICQP
jgi:hypothetical protein